MAEEPSENEQEWDNIRLREDEELEFFTELALHEAERWITVRVRISRGFFIRSMSSVRCDAMWIRCENTSPGYDRVDKIFGWLDKHNCM